jgi:hypothetical protein
MTHHRFIRAKKEVEQLAGKIMRKFYPTTLAKIKPRIDFLMCYASEDEAGNPTGPALKLHGTAAAATINVTSLIHRALGEGDVLIKIDGELWETFTPPQQTALLDHELYHLNPMMLAGTEKAKTDDLNRPMFKMRDHDYQFGWFTAIAARHGIASIEVQQAVMIRQKSGQLLFDFAGADQATLHIVDELVPAGA